jgi:hypothetical protein
MNLKFPIWSLVLAILCYVPIAWLDLNIWYALVPTAYLAFVFITVSFYAIKRTFFK